MDQPDHKREDDWFRHNERRLLEAAREARVQRERERAAREKDEETRRLKQLHFMKCPKCGHDMKAESQQGIEIDRCSFCEGIFLDAGEMEDVFLKKKTEERQGITRWLLGI